MRSRLKKPDKVSVRARPVGRVRRRPAPPALPAQWFSQTERLFIAVGVWRSPIVATRAGKRVYARIRFNGHTAMRL